MREGKALPPEDKPRNRKPRSGSWRCQATPQEPASPMLGLPGGVGWLKSSGNYVSYPRFVLYHIYVLVVWGGNAVVNCLTKHGFSLMSGQKILGVSGYGRAREFICVCRAHARVMRGPGEGTSDVGRSLPAIEPPLDWTPKAYSVGGVNDPG